MIQLKLTDNYRTFHSSTKEYTFFSECHGNFSKIGHILGNNANTKRHKDNWNNTLFLMGTIGGKVRIQQHKLQESYKLLETE